MYWTTLHHKGLGLAQRLGHSTVDQQVAGANTPPPYVSLDNSVIVMAFKVSPFQSGVFSGKEAGNKEAGNRKQETGNRK